MCGFAGLLYSRPYQLEKIKYEITNMIRSINHRGPDDEGLWIDPNLGLGIGHKRLAIQDLSKNGYQPMESRNGRFIIAFNGEIYNHLDLRKELQNSGIISSNWIGTSDTETILACLVAWGLNKSLKKFVGMFSFVLLDKYNKKLFLVRDRFGEKPIYYGFSKKHSYEYNNFLTFASEISAFKSLKNLSSSININALNSFFNFGYVRGPNSIREGIYQIQPGELLEIKFSYKPNTMNFSDLKKYKWFDSKNLFIVNEKNKYKESEVLKKTEDLIINSINNQSISKVPIGTFLSGGIDSTLITALLQKNSNQSINSFTISLPDDSSKNFNEGHFAKKIAKHLGTNHTEISISEDHIFNFIKDIPKVYSEPFADSSQIPTTIVCSMARKSGLSVVLTGDGGDEIFGGYNRYNYIPKINNLFGKLPKVILELIFSSISNTSNLIKDEYTSQKYFKLSHSIKNANELSKIYNYLVSIWPDPDEIINKEFSSINKDSFFTKLSSKRNNLVLSDLYNYLPYDILTKLDRASMYSSLETRSPFLDHRIAEFVCPLPWEYKLREGINNTQNKWILRKILYKYVPRNFVDRPKKGFSIPLGTWLKGPLRSWAEDLLDPNIIKSQGYLNNSVVRKYWAELLEGNTNHSSKIWTILMWQAWLLEWT